MNNLLTGFLTSGESTSSATIGLIMVIILIMFLAMIGLYVYTSLALMRIAKKTKTEPAWLAWIPIGNSVLLSRIAAMHWWPVLLYIPAFVSLIIAALLNHFTSPVAGMIFIVLYYLIIAAFTVYSTIWLWKMYEKVGRPGGWAVLPLGLGIFGMIFILAGGSTATYTSLIGWIISLIGIVMSLIFMGVAAWGNTRPIPIRKKRN
jgi:hypothetical protein